MTSLFLCSLRNKEEMSNKHILVYAVNAECGSTSRSIVLALLKYQNILVSII